MTKWVLGFIFNETGQVVLLLKKRRGPKFNIGKLNGIGGKIERGESPLQAIIREAKEETGIEDFKADWRQFATLETESGTVECFSIFSFSMYNYKQLEDEELGNYDISSLTNSKLKGDLTSNLSWLIGMALENRDNDRFYIIDQIDN